MREKATRSRWEQNIASTLAALLLCAVTSPLRSDAGATFRTFRPPPTVYTFGNAIYDRFFGPLTTIQKGPLFRYPRVTRVSAPEYAIGGINLGYPGYPTAVNDSGLITYEDVCNCVDLDGSIGEVGDNEAFVIDDEQIIHANIFTGMAGEYDAGGAIPFAINSAGYSAGDYFDIYGGSYFSGNKDWSPSGLAVYFGQMDPHSLALAVNDNNISVGQDNGGPAGSYAAQYRPISSPGGTMIRTLLMPPKNTSWVGTATGIDDGGEIIGYAIFPNRSSGRAVRFVPGGFAQVLPVGAPSVSTSAQAINMHGDVVGNAGSQAFLYRRNRVIYLPRPPGETAGNAVAYAINSSDEVVGDIVTDSGTTAFLYVNGASYDLDSLIPVDSGWQITHAAGINDKGQIVGTGIVATYGDGGAFSMKPVPRR